MQKLLIGADPELFLINNLGRFVSSIGKIGGSKDAPYPIDDEGNAVQEDNVAVEFNIPACSTKDQFIKAINKNLDWIKERAKELDLDILVVPSASFSDEELDHPRAREFGCEPDYDAWTGEMNPKPNAADPNLRSCGGHVHIATDLNKEHVIRCADVVLGLWSVFHDNNTDRRQLYGKRGAYRPKPYGVEYRTLSNFWLQSDELKGEVWDRTVKTVELATKTNPADILAYRREIAEGINYSNKVLAKAVMKVFGV